MRAASLLHHPVFVWLTILATSTLAPAAEICVNWDGSGDFTKIQDGLDAANDGDVVIVYPGTYRETIDFPARAMTLTGTDPNDPNVVEATVIDGDLDQDPNTPNGSVVTLVQSQSWPGPDRLLSGLTITGGKTPGSPGPANGGGINGNWEYVTIAHCRIVGNVASHDGGGVAHCRGTISDCTISGNEADYGGGIYGDWHSTVLRCTIDNNEANDGGGAYGCSEISDCTVRYNEAASYGGGLNYCNEVSNCRILGNRAGTPWNGGVGGGLYYCSRVTDCVIVENGAMQWSDAPTFPVSGYGGGLYVCDTITNCTITRNVASEGAGIHDAYEKSTVTSCRIVGNGVWYDSVDNTYTYSGGAMYVNSGSTIKNSVISGNTAQSGGGIYGTSEIDGCTIAKNSAAEGSGVYGSEWWGSIDNTVIWYDSVASTYAEVAHSCIEGGYEGEGNIDEDPNFFAAPAGAWTAEPIYDPEIGQSVLTDDAASWPEGELAGKIINPDTSQPTQYVIVDNTATTLTVWGDATLVRAGSAYEVFDYRLSPTSPCINTGDPLARPSEDETDIDGDPRRIGRRIDMGADEAVEWLRVLNTDTDVRYVYLQEAIDAAEEGHTLVADASLYYETIDFFNKNVRLIGEDPNDPNIVAQTIIHGDADRDPNTADGPVVTFEGAEDANCVLSGFTITGGRTFYGMGGGISGNGTGATVIRCVVTGNVASYEEVDGGGAGMPCSGGGIYDCDGLIAFCTVRGNRAYFGGGGLAECGGTIDHCLITGNFVNWDGGGLFSCSGTITHCTISGNRAGGDGAGLAYCGGTITNSIVFGNEDDQLFESVEPTYSCIEGGSAGSGCIADDPCFAAAGFWTDGGLPDELVDDVWTSGDYHLRSQQGRWEPGTGWVIDPNDTSPCIDAADPNASIAEEVMPNGSRANMGVYGATAEASKTYSAPTITAIEPNSGPRGTRFRIVGHDFGAEAGSVSYGDVVTWTDSEIFVDVPPDAWTGTQQIIVATAGGGTSDPSEFTVDQSATTVEVGPAGTAWSGSSSYPFPTIQQALLASDAGDTVLVRPGTYRERVSLAGRDIILTGTTTVDWSVIGNTIIDGNIDLDAGTPDGPVVTFDGTEPASCMLAGLTVTGGSSATDGGGIQGNGTLATLTRCLIRDNTAVAGGGGVFDCDGLIDGCRVLDNTASGVIQGMGGGLCRCDGTIRSCIVANNQAGFSGGGLFDCDADISNCSVVGNGTSQFGGGLCARLGACTIMNCIFWANSSGSPTLGEQIACISQSQMTVSYCDVQGGNDGVFKEGGSGFYWGAGNVEADPLFTNPGSGDYHIPSGSPCANAGDPAGDYSGQCDVDGDPRASGVVDIGADEHWTKYVLDLTVTNDDKGHVEVDPCAPDYDFLPGTEVTLTAVPNEDAGFSMWKIYDPNHPGDANYLIEDTNTTITLTMEGDREMEAVFKCGSGVGSLTPMMLGLLGLFVATKRWA